MSELKPCPFCGCEAESYSGITYSSVICKSCSAKAATHEGEEYQRNAETAWNTRPIEDRLRAVNAELVEALGDLVDIMEDAGLLNLSRGVQLGPTVWLVKATERVAYAKDRMAAIKRARGE